jgi:hypothetical protein
VLQVRSAGRYFKVPAGTLMFRPVLQNVLEVPAGTSNPNQSAKYKLEVPAGTSNPNQSAGRYFEFLKNVFNFFFCIYPFVQSCSTFYDKHQIL